MGTHASLRALLAVLLGLVAGCAGDERPPNLLLISVDTLRPDRLGCYGHARDTSPSIDALAAAGVLFEDASSASPWTLPSHASLLTGRYPSHHGVRESVHRLPESVPTLASLLAERGYETLAVVNSYNVSKRFGFDRGFDRFRYVAETGPRGSIPNRGAQVLGIAREWLTRRSEQPFFLFVHCYDVHTDLTPSEEHRERFAGDYAGRFDGRTSQMIEQRSRGTPPSPADAAHLLDLYDAEVRTFDDLLGGFLGWLEAEGLLEETLLVLTSDHGEEFGEHGSLLHGRTYFEEVIRIPLVVRGPGVPAGQRVTTPVHLVDVAPTLLAAAGVAPPPGMDGLDLRALWSSPGDASQRPLFAEADHNNAQPDIRSMLRAGRYKLVHDRLEDGVSLFDLVDDPHELRDLARDEPELAAELLGRLRAFAEGATTGDAIDAPGAEAQRRLRELGY